MTWTQFRTLQGGRNVMQNEGSNICKSFSVMFSYVSAPLETWLGLASSLDRLVNAHATKNQRNAAKGAPVYSVSLAKVERTELSSETDSTVAYWLRMALYVHLFFFSPYSPRDLKTKPKTTKALSAWWKSCLAIKPFAYTSFNSTVFRALDDKFSAWCIKNFTIMCHTAKCKIT